MRSLQTQDAPKLSFHIQDAHVDGPTVTLNEHQFTFSTHGFQIWPRWYSSSPETGSLALCGAGAFDYGGMEHQSFMLAAGHGGSLELFLSRDVFGNQMSPVGIKYDDGARQAASRTSMCTAQQLLEILKAEPDYQDFPSRFDEVLRKAFGQTVYLGIECASPREIAQQCRSLGKGTGLAWHYGVGVGVCPSDAKCWEVKGEGELKAQQTIMGSRKLHDYGEQNAGIGGYVNMRSRTRKSPQEIQEECKAWCHDNPKYSVSSHNCQHFARHLYVFLTGQRFPFLLDTERNPVWSLIGWKRPQDSADYVKGTQPKYR
ncbi:unnamed protein product [Symbiodinium sp. CCMP2592]|nr:unnamed protein product [Symbiodinium sp. CCMP2592]